SFRRSADSSSAVVRQGTPTNGRLALDPPEALLSDSRGMEGSNPSIAPIELPNGSHSAHEPCFRGLDSKYCEYWLANEQLKLAASLDRDSICRGKTQLFGRMQEAPRFEHSTLPTICRAQSRAPIFVPALVTSHTNANARSAPAAH